MFGIKRQRSEKINCETYVADNGHKSIQFISLVSHEVQVPGKSFQKGKRTNSSPPEVDVEDQEVVDYIGVVAVFGMCVDDPIHITYLRD